MLFIPKVIIAYCLLINALTIFAFYLDKQAATKGRQRISERTLLLLAFLGGSPLAIVAKKKFRHKTVKQPFNMILTGIIMFQLFALIAALYFLSKTFASL